VPDVLSVADLSEVWVMVVSRSDKARSALSKFEAKPGRATGSGREGMLVFMIEQNNDFSSFLIPKKIETMSKLFNEDGDKFLLTSQPTYLSECWHGGWEAHYKAENEAAACCIGRMVA